MNAKLRIKIVQACISGLCCNVWRLQLQAHGVGSCVYSFYGACSCWGLDRSHDSLVIVCVWGNYHFSYTKQVFTLQDDGIEHMVVKIPQSIYDSLGVRILVAFMQAFWPIYFYELWIVRRRNTMSQDMKITSYTTTLIARLNFSQKNKTIMVLYFLSDPTSVSITLVYSKQYIL